MVSSSERISTPVALSSSDAISVNGWRSMPGTAATGL
jgi:hypothetical protein